MINLKSDHASHAVCALEVMQECCTTPAHTSSESEDINVLLLVNFPLPHIYMCGTTA